MGVLRRQLRGSNIHLHVVRRLTTGPRFTDAVMQRANRQRPLRSAAGPKSVIGIGNWLENCLFKFDGLCAVCCSSAGCGLHGSDQGRNIRSAWCVMNGAWTGQRPRFLCTDRWALRPSVSHWVSGTLWWQQDGVDLRSLTLGPSRFT